MKNATRVRLTAERVAEFTCPPAKSQAFLWDTDTPRLALRVTPTKRRTYVFEGRLNGNTIRINIGTPQDWPLDNAVVKNQGTAVVLKQGARDRAQELGRLVDRGIDPRDLAREEAVAREASKAAAHAEKIKAALTVGEVWAQYLRHGKPRGRDAWKPRYLSDLQKMTSAGGEKKKRGKGLTKPGPLAPLMAVPLAQISQDLVRDWYVAEAKRAPVQATRAMAMFSGFLTWCGTRKQYRELVDRTAARASELKDVLRKTKEPRTDALEIAQLAAWFAGTYKLHNRTAAVYLQALLLTGARREEMASLKWDDINFRWYKLILADKVEVTRTIPLSPYMAWLLRSLPKVEGNPHVFASTISASGHIMDARKAHAEVLEDAVIEHISIHGLRRSFALLGEAAGAPAGAIAQVMGHKPSGVHEGYKPRSIDALRPYLRQVEDFILEKAGIRFEPEVVAERGLRVISAA